MVVVEGGREYLNQAIEVVVTSVLQSARGKMLFAEPKTAEGKMEGGIDYSTRPYAGGRKRRPIR
jgi:hypothetical protein